MRWQSWQLQHWSQGCEPLLFERIVKTFFDMGPADPAAIAKGEAIFRKEAKVLDDHLAKRSHLVADRVTLAEYSVAPYLVHAKGAGMPLDEFPNAKRWFGEIAKLPSWQAYLPKA